MTVDPNFKVNPLVEALVPDGGDPPELTCLVGYLGRSPRRNHLRLYLRTPTLQGWADIPFSRVRHMMYSKPWRAERFGVNQVWVLGKSIVVDGLEPVYPGGQLALASETDLATLFGEQPMPVDTGTGGGQPGGKGRLYPPPPPPPPFK